MYIFSHVPRIQRNLKMDLRSSVHIFIEDALFLESDLQLEYSNFN